MNNIKRKISISFIIYMFIAVPCGCRDNQYDVNANEGVQLKEIIIGSDIQPPFNYVDSDGNPTGIDVELATEAFRRMGYKAVFVNINWDDKQELLSSHTIDCIWGSFSMNGREDKYRWAGPYMKSSIVIAVNKDSNIYTIEDLWDKTVAVQAASKPEEMFLNMEDSRIPRIRSLLSMKNRELTYPMLSKGYADALAVNEVIINQYMKDYNMQFRILEESLDTVGLGVAFDKNDKRDIDRRLTDILINMRDDCTEKEILEKYVGDTDKYLEVGAYE